MRNWNIDEVLCDLARDDVAVLVRVRAGVTDEPYRAHTSRREFVPLTVSSGIRTRVIGHLYTRERSRTVQKIGEVEAYFYQWTPFSCSGAVV